MLYEAIAGIGDAQLDQNNLNEILKGYLEAALWTEEERLGDDYKENLGYDDSEYQDDNDDDEIEKLIHMKQKLESTPFERFIVDDLENNSKIQAYMDIKNFIRMAGPAATMEAIQEDGFFKFGMDIWLSRNRHGAGFFDYNYEHEKELMDAAHVLKEVDLYVTDNNTIAFGNS
jgi:hypothetical protein